VEDLDEQLSSVGALAEPVRRALYDHVVSQPQPVSREQAAAAVDIPLHTAKFHLDRLVDAGLLEVEFRRLSGRTGPGAGRPSKLYRRSSRQLSVSLPERRYDLVAEVLADAVDASLSAGAPIADTLRSMARKTGRRIGAALVRTSDTSEGAAAAATPTALGDHLETAAQLLADYGYEPRISEDEVCLANCPFDRLAAEHTELVCGMNLNLISGALDALHVDDLRADLAPQPGFCCVRVTRRDAAAGAEAPV
jgi:predicted ArsR family transcriptional regulator